MDNKYPYLFALLLAHFVFGQVPAQQMMVSEPLSIRNDYGYEIIGRLRDRILLFRDKYDDFEIQAFDAQMRPAWTKKLEDIDKRGVQILAVIGRKNDFTVIYKMRRRSETLLRMHKYDPGANLIDSMTVKSYGERMFTPPALDILVSEDRNCVVVFNTAERGSMELVCFQLDKMQVNWDKTVQFEQDYYESMLKSLTLSNNGTFFLITEYNNRRTKSGAHEFQVLRIAQSDESIHNIPLREYLTSDVKFVYDNTNRQLVGAGLYGEKHKDRSNGMFYLRLPNAGQPVVHYSSLDDKLISVLKRKDIEEDTKGINDADVRQLVLRQDGGVVMVVERHHEVQRGAGAGRGFWRDGMRMIVDFYFDDLFIAAFHPDGTLHWSTVLHKKQYSQDDEGTFSSYFLFRNQDRLHFMFNDEIKYENTCSEYLISPLGEFDRNSLLTTASQNLRLRFRDGIQISSAECLIPSEFRNKLKLVLLRF